MVTTQADDAIQPTAGRKDPNDLKVAWMFVLPALVGFGVFYLWPVLRGTYLSFTEYNVLGTPSWIGLQNYRDVLHDDLFWNALRVTLTYVVINIGLQTIVALGLAVLMHRFTKSTFVRGVFIVPWMIANVIVALVWYWMLDFQIGIVNEMLGWIGIDPIAFFGDSKWAMPTIALINVWRHIGYTALLIFAGLQTIPESVYEAAKMDGSSEWRTFWRVTMPLLRPVLVLVLVLTVIGSFQVFDTIAVTTQGGPENATRAIYYYIYEEAFIRNNFGYASAMSVILVLVLAGVAIAQLKLLRADESDLA